MHHPEEDNSNTPEKPKRRRGRPSTTDKKTVIQINVSESTARHLEALVAHANKKIIELGFPATVDAAKMLDMWVETMVTEKFKEIGKK